LARFANRAKAQAISRMPTARRIATLVAFVHCLEATSQDEVLEVLEMLLHDLFGKAITVDQKARLRTLKDLDESAAALAEACRLLLDPDVPDESLRKKVFTKIPRAAMIQFLMRFTHLVALLHARVSIAAWGAGARSQQKRSAINKIDEDQLRRYHTTYATSKKIVPRLERREAKWNSYR
jgi:hypothetical protein